MYNFIVSDVVLRAVHMIIGWEQQVKLLEHKK